MHLLYQGNICLRHTILTSLEYLAFFLSGEKGALCLFHMWSGFPFQDDQRKSSSEQMSDIGELAKW